MQITKENYYSKEANIEYLSVSQFKDFTGTLGFCGCEERALAKLRGEYIEEPSKSMLQGSYIDACYEGSIEEFKKNNPVMFTLKGELKAEFKQAQEAFERTQRDKLFKKYMSGEKQVIMAAELWGAKWKCKIDSYLPKKAIIDLKFVKDIYEKIYVKDLGYLNFIEYWGYDFQMAVYQKIVEANTGYLLPCYIAVVDKKKNYDIEVIQILQNNLDKALDYYEMEKQTKRIIELKKGNLIPCRCGTCDWCIDTKILTAPISSDLI